MHDGDNKLVSAILIFAVLFLLTIGWRQVFDAEPRPRPMSTERQDEPAQRSRASQDNLDPAAQIANIDFDQLAAMMPEGGVIDVPAPDGPTLEELDREASRHLDMPSWIDRYPGSYLYSVQEHRPSRTRLISFMAEAQLSDVREYYRYRASNEDWIVVEEKSDPSGTLWMAQYDPGTGEPAVTTTIFTAPDELYDPGMRRSSLVMLLVED